VETRGSLGEYAISLGFNFKDVVYLGATLGIQSLNYTRTVFYGEDYIYNDENRPSGAEMPYQLTYMNYEQRTRISGTGFNFKIGATIRPVNWLRIGVAYHTPTYYGLTLRYGADMWSETSSAGDNPEGYDVPANGKMFDEVSSPIWEDAGPNSWNFRSPSRLLTGVAVTLGKRIIVSADYERSWYQSTRLQQSPILGLDYTGQMKEFFKGSNTIRVGAEAYLLPFLPIRVGYIWNGSTLRKGYEHIVATHPIPTQQQYVTAGFGIKFSQTVYMDFAYQYGTTKYSSYQTFYAIDSEDADQNIESDLFTTNTNRHIAVMTLGFRF
jgi:long-subunit fatty acid transport protein